MISPRQLEIYNNLLKLTQKNDSFYFNDQEIDGVKMRIFAYRIASYTDWLEPDALESRGIMFELDSNDNPVRLACRPLSKFFNVNENPFTMNLDFSKVTEIQEKVDGSLMSTYIVNDRLYLKSKTSLTSEHCIAAMKHLDALGVEIKEQLYEIARAGFTINLEWCSPQFPFRIVIAYDKPQLRILNIRNMETGKHFQYPIAYMHHLPDGLMLAERLNLNAVSDAAKFVESIPSMVDIEGYVIKFGDDLWAKHKTTWYLTLHNNKESVNNPRKLFECAVNEATDDLRTLFHDDLYSLNLINEMEQRVSKLHNNLVVGVENFYETNKHLSRKDYAILATNTLDKLHFVLSMQKYLGKDVNYKESLIKNYKNFGIQDTVEVTD